MKNAIKQHFMTFSRSRSHARAGSCSLLASRSHTQIWFKCVRATLTAASAVVVVRTGFKSKT